MGSLVNYIVNADAAGFQPMNITFALLPPLEEVDRRRLKRKADRHRYQVELALQDFEDWRLGYLEANRSYEVQKHR
jgi:methylenetetrahydrofolate--tRNA-(uracil-5-)-methyltransferase